MRENLLEAVAGDADDVVSAVPSSSTTRPDYVDRVCYGGMPLAPASVSLGQSPLVR